MIRNACLVYQMYTFIKPTKAYIINTNKPEHQKLDISTIQLYWSLLYIKYCFVWLVCACHMLTMPVVGSAFGQQMLHRIETRSHMKSSTNPLNSSAKSGLSPLKLKIMGTLWEGRAHRWVSFQWIKLWIKEATKRTCASPTLQQLMKEGGLLFQIRVKLKRKSGSLLCIAKECGSQLVLHNPCEIWMQVTPRKHFFLFWHMWYVAWCSCMLFLPLGKFSVDRRIGNFAKLSWKTLIC